MKSYDSYEECPRETVARVDDSTLLTDDGRVYTLDETAVRARTGMVVRCGACRTWLYREESRFCPECGRRFTYTEGTW